MDGVRIIDGRGISRIAAIGSVDDGKSTLIGRLILDAGALLNDERRAMEVAARRRGLDGPDLAALTDGLTAERAQGITIDVAWRHFATARRRFLLADVPGHEQYTRNMLTGASTADAALVVVDAGVGMTSQSRRHLAVALLLGVRAVVVAVNKMDAVGYDRGVFESVRRAVESFATAIDASAVPCFVPISALRGDNVVRRSDVMTWYDGPTLLAVLEALPTGGRVAAGPLRFPVQLVRRAQDDAIGGAAARGYLGRIESGSVAVGDDVLILPSGVRTRIGAVHGLHGPVQALAAPTAATIYLADQVDVTRGDMIVGADRPPIVGDRFDALVFWLDERPLDRRRSYLLRHGTRTLRAMLPALHHALDIGSGRRITANALGANEIATGTVRLEAPAAFDPRAVARETGAFVLIDDRDDATIAAGLILTSDAPVSA